MDESNIKTGELFVAGYHLQCPHCDELIENEDNGSQIWYTTECEPGKIVTCGFCGDKVRMPPEA